MWARLLQRVYPELHSETAQVSHMSQEIDYEAVPRVVCLAIVMFSEFMLSFTVLTGNEAKYNTSNHCVIQDDVLICVGLSSV